MSTAGNHLTSEGVSSTRVSGQAQSGSIIQWFGEIAVLAVLYYLGACLGLRFSIPPGNASAIWPPSGIALAALMLRSWTIFPGIWLAAFFANSQTQVSLLTAASFATGNTASALVAFFWCKAAFDRKGLFHVPSDALKWMLVAAVSTSLAATCGACNLYWGGYIGRERLLETWFTWWVGDLSGVMILAPALVMIRTYNGLISLPPHRLLELGGAFLSLIVVSQFLFGGWLPETKAEGLLYLPMILIIWLLLRFGLEAVLAGNVLIACLAVWGTSRDVGAFATEVRSQSLFHLQVFLNLYAAAGLLMSGVRIKGRDAEQRRQLLDVEVRANRAQLLLAYTIQSRLFPTGPLCGENYVCAGIWQPTEVTSGDYFDFIRQSDGTVVLIIADVSGHGLGPALLMAETRAYVHALVDGSSSLTEIIHRLNGLIFDDTQIGRFVTFALCRFDPRTCELEFVGAGHNGIIVRADDSWENLCASTLPLGLVSDLPAAQLIRKQLNAGDLIFLYTDGFVETRLPDGDLYGRERLIETLIANRQNDLEKLLRHLVDEVARVSQKEAPSDDRAALILRVQ